MQEVLDELETKEFGVSDGSGITLSFRFPDGKVDHTFHKAASLKVST